MPAVLDPTMVDKLMSGMTTTKKKPCCKTRKREPWMDGTLLTEYQKEYFKKMVPHGMRDLLKPLDNPRDPKAQFDGHTTYKGDFQGAQGPREAAIKASDSLHPEQAAFNGDSTYAKDFEAKQVPYLRVRPKHALNPSEGPFVADTTYGQAFLDKGVPQPAMAIRHQSQPRSAGPFEGNTVYKDSYHRWPVSRTQAAVPLKASGAMPTGKLDDATMYKTSYTPKVVEVPERMRPGNRPRTPQDWYDGAPTTEYGKQFYTKQTPTSKAAVPVAGNKWNTGPFDGSTNYNSDFRPYSAPIAAQVVIPQGSLETDKQPFVGESTYGGAFTGKNVPYARVRPQHALAASLGPFDPTTTYRTNFNEKDVQAATKVLPRRQLPDKLPFEGTSVYKNDFTKMANAKRNPAKPLAGGQSMPSGPFDDLTTYKVDYIPRQIEARPGTACSCDDSPGCVDEDDLLVLQQQAAAHRAAETLRASKRPPFLG